MGNLLVVVVVAGPSLLSLLSFDSEVATNTIITANDEITRADTTTIVVVIVVVVIFAVDAVDVVVDVDVAVVVVPKLDKRPVRDVVLSSRWFVSV